MTEKLKRARAELEAERTWDDVREQRLLQGAVRTWRERRAAARPARRSYRGAAGALAGLVAAAVVVLVLARRSAPERAIGPAPSPSAPSGEQTWSLADGSRVTYGAEARLQVEEATAGRVRIRQLAGAATYAVAHHPERVFVVQAADVEVRVRGTRFRVALEDDWVTVAVDEGHVEVDDGDHVTSLLALDSARVRAWRSPEASGVDTTAAAPSPEPKPLAPPSPGAAREAELDGMLARANEARAHGDLAEAAARLHALLARHPDRARQSVALFTLGRVERARGSSAAAAAAFARCHRVATSASLAEDALAEAAESYMAAGATAEARDAAAAYLDQYPAGTHAPRMRTLLR